MRVFEAAFSGLAFPADGGLMGSMTGEIQFNRDFKTLPGRPETVFPGVQRILAPNPSPFTFTGTCTYLAGDKSVTIIDPGPHDASHIKAILEAVGGRKVTHILVTHTHRDHSMAVPAIQAATGAQTYGEGPHRPSRPLREGENNPMEAGGDPDFVPDVRLRDGDSVTAGGQTFEAITTPGHTANHLVFALKGTNCLFSGDHVMGWSTSIVAPPDGSMSDYMDSLHKLRARKETFYLPGHGPAIENAREFVDRYIEHRQAREQAIVRRLERGETDIPGLVQSIYIGLDPKLAGAAGLTTLAHLENLVEHGVIATDGPPSLKGRYRLV
jgi:glyoxylase-like metal-dependent hydrolase (beta-lactamase superfamily II)